MLRANLISSSSSPTEDREAFILNWCRFRDFRFQMTRHLLTHQWK